jgi:hypothetical protein
MDDISPWTEFEHETSSYHLSNRYLITHQDDNEDLGFPTKRATHTQKTPDFPAMIQPAVRPLYSQTQSEPLHSNGMKPSRTRSVEDRIDKSPPTKCKNWSPKRLMCGISSRDSSGAFPSIPNNIKSNRSGAFPSIPFDTASHRSVQTAPAAYIPLESKKHDNLERRQYLHSSTNSRHHLEFKQTMKELLEQEYSPYYVKRKTPSLLSHFTGDDGKSSNSTITSNIFWKSKSRRSKEWFERSESKKGKLLSTKPRSMDLVFFETVAAVGTSEESFDIETIQEEDEEEEHEWDQV